MTTAIIDLLEGDAQGRVLLDALLEAPEEGIHSSAFADWLEENGATGVELVRGSFAEEVRPPAAAVSGWLGGQVAGKMSFTLHQGLLRVESRGLTGWASLPLP